MARSARFAALLLLAAGCTGVFGIEALPHASTPCEFCALACADEHAACRADVECAALDACQRACRLDDPLCRRSCEEAHPSWPANAPFLAYDRCLRTSCVDACYGTGGLIAAIDPACGSADAACKSLLTQCVQTNADGVAPGTCERVLACIASDPNPDNYLHCFNALPPGHAALPVLDCARQNAQGSCPLRDGELECLPPPVGKGYRYGISRDEEVEFTLTVENLAFRPVEGAQVIACDPQAGCAANCEPAQSSHPSEATDKDGKARVRVPIASYHYSGCFQVVPPAGDMLPNSVFTGRLVRQPEDQLTTYLFTLGEIAGAAATAPVPVDADLTTHGQVVGTVHDCLWWRVSGATVEITGGDATTVVGYIDDVHIGANPYTYSSGFFAIFNVPPGRHTVTAKRDGRVIATETIEVIAGHVADANLFPTALP